MESSPSTPSPFLAATTPPPPLQLRSMTPPFLPPSESSRAVEDAIQEALQLIQTYSDDPTDWRDRPELIYASLDAARNDIARAWTELQSAADVGGRMGGGGGGEASATDGGGSPATTTSSNTEQEIRVAFVDMITDAFADVLQHQREQQQQQQGGSTGTDMVLDVETLVDCLQSGLDMMNITGVSDLAWYNDEEDDVSLEGEEELDPLDASSADHHHLTPHEQRRRAMGFPVVAEEAAAA